jgi:hypothetical protein
MMKTENDTLTWEIELLTPLHIGDGTELQSNLDYISDKKSIDVIEFDSLLESLSDCPSAINDLSKSVSLKQLLEDDKLNVKPRYSLSFKGNSAPKSMRRFLKNGFGQPYISGSSLKGAIHTALWTSLDRSGLPLASKFDPFNEAVKALGGIDPYHMFIRPLQISDSIGVEPEGALICEEIKIFNLLRENKPGWKDFVIFLECLKPKIKLYFQARIDPLLNTASAKKIGGITECSGLASFGSLLETINAHSLHIAERDQVFFSNYGSETDPVAEFYKKLLVDINAVKHDPGTAFLRLSWGSGWRGMTGDWIEGDSLMEIRKANDPGKRGCPIFPKTRRLAIDTEKGTHSLPLGWVKISSAHNSQFSINM